MGMLYNLSLLWSGNMYSDINQKELQAEYVTYIIFVNKYFLNLLEYLRQFLRIESLVTLGNM